MENYTPAQPPMYSGKIVRDGYSADDWECEWNAPERIHVKAASSEEAECKILEIYNKDQKRWIEHRTDQQYPEDKKRVKNLVFIRDKKALEGFLKDENRNRRSNLH